MQMTFIVVDATQEAVQRFSAAALFLQELSFAGSTLCAGSTLFVALYFSTSTMLMQLVLE